MASPDLIESALTMQGGASSPPQVDAIEASLLNPPKPFPTPKSGPLPQTQGPMGAFTDPQFYRDLAGNALDIPKAFVHHAMNFPHGVAQLVEHGVDKAAGYLPSPSPTQAQLVTGEKPVNPISAYIHGVVSADDAALAERERAYQQTVPNTPGAYVGATAGEIAPFLFGGELQKGLQKVGEVGAAPFNAIATKFPKLAYLASLLGKGAGGATQGAVIGAGIPVTEPGDYANQKKQQIGSAALVGGATPVAVEAGKGVYNSIRGLAAPILAPQSVVGNALRKWAGPNADEIANKLSNVAELVPGSTPNTAQLAGSPELVQAEKTIANNPSFKPQFLARELQNNEARLAAINQVAGEPGALEAATKERARVAQNLYGYAFDHPPEEVTPWMKGQVTQLMKRPAIQQATKTARVLAANEGVKFTDATSIQGLHYTKVALDDQIGEAVRAGNDNQARILIDTRDKLVTLIEKMSPTYAQARSEFAQMSKPINTMSAGRDIAEGIANGALDASGKPVVTLPGFRSKLSAALRNSEYGINPESQAALENVQKDLQRATISNAVKTPGSDTAFNLQAPGWLAKHLYGENFSGPTGVGKIMGGLLGGGLTGHPILGAAAGYAGAEKIGQFAGNRVNEELAKVLLDPKLAAELLRNGNDPAVSNALIRLLSERAPQAAAYSLGREATPMPSRVNQ